MDNQNDYILQKNLNASTNVICIRDGYIKQGKALGGLK